MKVRAPSERPAGGGSPSPGLAAAVRLEMAGVRQLAVEASVLGVSPQCPFQA